MGEVPKQLKKYQFKPGHSGNPSGRPRDTLKDFARKYFRDMNTEERLAFLNGIQPGEVWRMAEGNPKEEKEISGKLSISQILDELDGSTPKEQRVEGKPPLQDNK